MEPSESFVMVVCGDSGTVELQLFSEDGTQSVTRTVDACAAIDLAVSIIGSAHRSLEPQQSYLSLES
jgi:hypothetical protein